MVVTRKLLIRAVAIVVALFVIAFPLGDSVVGEIVFHAFLIGFVVLIGLGIVGAVQSVRARRAGS